MKYILLIAILCLSFCNLKAKEINLIGLQNKYIEVTSLYENHFKNEILNKIVKNIAFESTSIRIIPYLRINDTLNYSKLGGRKEFYNCIGIDESYNYQAFVIFEKLYYHLYILEGKVVWKECHQVIRNKDVNPKILEKGLIADGYYLSFIDLPTTYRIEVDSIVAFNFYNCDLYETRNNYIKGFNLNDDFIISVDLSSLRVIHNQQSYKYKNNLLELNNIDIADFENSASNAIIIIPFLTITDTTLFDKTYLNKNVNKKDFYKSIGIDTTNTYQALLFFEDKWYNFIVLNGDIKLKEQYNSLGCDYPEELKYILINKAMYPVNVNYLLYCSLLDTVMDIDIDDIKTITPQMKSETDLNENISIYEYLIKY